MCAKSKSPTPMKTSENQKLAAPRIRELLAHMKSYKKVESVTVKLPMNIALYVREQGGSTYVREALIEKLRREADEEARV